MKKSYITVTLTLLSLVLLAGCSHTPDTSPTSGDTTGVIPGTGNNSGPGTLTRSGINNQGEVVSMDVISETVVLTMTQDNQSIVKNLVTNEPVVIKVNQPNEDSIFIISQIKYPDGTLEGPFGAQLEFRATIPGEYEFIIGPNLMASNTSYTGDVVVDVLMPIEPQ